MSGGSGDITTNTTTHTEEQVFSSDGLPPLETPSFPPSLSSTNKHATVTTASTGGDCDAVVEEEALMNPVEAFEVFGGRLFVSSTTAAAAGGGAGGGYIRGDGRSVTDLTHQQPQHPQEAFVETPLERLARLRMEVNELERDLRLQSNTSAESHHEHAEATATATAPMQAMVRALSDRLQEVALMHKNQHASGTQGDGVALTHEGLQSELTQRVMQELHRRQKESAGDDKQQETNQKQDTDAKDAGGGGGGKVVYELYTPTISTKDHDDKNHSASASASTSALEARLSRMERILGSTTTPTGSHNTLLQRLGRAERLAQSMDAEKMQAAAARAKVVRTDLEAALKARTKLSTTTTYTTTTPLTPEDTQRLTSLYHHYTSIQSFSTQLPTLLTRLHQLSNLHTQAADFATRMSQVEDAVIAAERLALGLEEALKSVEEGWVKNGEVWERNLEVLDGRFRELLEKKG